MTTLYVQQQGALLLRQDNTLIVQYRNEGQTIKQRIPAEKVSEVVVGNGCHITSGAIELMLKMQVPISFVGFHEDFIGAVVTPLNGNQLLRREQYRGSERPDIALYLARQFVLGKVQNQRTIIQRYAREITELEEPVKMMRHFAEMVENAPDIETMMGYEGQAAKLYFAGLGLVLGETWQFNGRNRRPPRDPINAMLSYGYTLLEAHIIGSLHRVGLDPFVGFLHSPFPGRKSLALDILEEFRPVIVDSAILGIIGNRMLTPDNFTMEMGSCKMSDETRKTFLLRFQARLDQAVVHHITQEKITYSKWITAQARLLAAFLLGEVDRYVPVRIR